MQDESSLFPAYKLQIIYGEKFQIFNYQLLVFDIYKSSIDSLGLWKISALMSTII